MALKDAVKRSGVVVGRSAPDTVRVTRSGNIVTIEMPQGVGNDVPSFVRGDVGAATVMPLLRALKDVNKT